MTKVEAAYLALQTALAAKAATSDALPAPHRNAALVTAFDAASGSLAGGVFLNIHDDDAVPVGEIAGGGRGEREFYVVAAIEWVVERKDDAARDALFDAGIADIAAALEADRTLSGAVDDVEIEIPRRADLAISGAPRMKGATIPVRLLITAPTYLG